MRKKSIKEALFDYRKNIILNKAFYKGEVRAFYDEVYDNLKEYYFNGLPLSIQMKYGCPTSGSGKCDIRAMYLYFGIENGKVVRGFRKDLLLMGNSKDKWDGVHYWVEDDDWVYDPTALYMYKKDVYYKAHGVTDIKVFTEEELEKNGYYKRIKETKIEDYFPNGKRRSEAEAMVPLIEYTAQFDGKIAQELSEYTDKISFYNNNQENYPNLNLTN